MSRFALRSRVMLGAAAVSFVLLATACSDASGPSGDEGAIQVPRSEAPNSSPTARRKIGPQIQETDSTTTVAEAGGPSFSYTNASLPNLRGCFKYSTGAAYKSQPVYILYWTGSVWDYVRNSSGTLRSRKTDASGCVQFDDVFVGKYLALEAYLYLDYPTCAIWEGASKYIGPTAKNDAVWNVGTTVVSKIAQGLPYSYACLNM